MENTITIPPIGGTVIGTATATSVWVVGKFVTPGWELVGVFNSPEKAADQCLDRRYFSGMVQVNQVFTKEAPWRGTRSQ